MEQTELHMLLEEYKICMAEAARLESLSWKVSTQLGIFSGAGLLLKIVSTYLISENFHITIAIAVLMTTLSLVWWRLSRRWWSIQHTKYKRMNEIELKIGFRQNSLVRVTGESTMAHIKYVQHKYQRMEDYLFYRIPKRIQPIKPEDSENLYIHEHRGNQPVLRFFIYVNIVVWVALVFISAKTSCDYWGASLIFAVYFFFMIKYWRRP